MSTITSVSISNTAPTTCFAIPVDSSVTSTMGSDIVQLQFLGALQETNPTQFFVSVSMANGISAGEPSVNSRDSSKVDINITGSVLEGSGITAYSTINSNGGDLWQFEFAVNVDGRIVTYSFQKKRSR